MTDDNPLVGIGHHHIIDRDISHGQLRQAIEGGSTTGSAAIYARDVYVLENGRAFVNGRDLLYTAIAAHVIQVKRQRIARNIYHVDVVDIDVLHHATTTAGTFKPQSGVGTHKGTIGHIHILHAPRHLAADDKTAVAMQHDIVFDNDILAGLSTKATFLVTSRLQADGIVTGIEQAVGDEHIFARLHVEGIAILRIPGIEYLHVVHNQRFARKRVNAPCG